jgi:hypothetical protein
MSASPPAPVLVPATFVAEPLPVDTEAIDCDDGVLRIRTLGLRRDSRERATGLRCTLRAGLSGAAGEDEGGGVSSSSVRERIRPNIGCAVSPLSPPLALS